MSEHDHEGDHHHAHGHGDGHEHEGAHAHPEDHGHDHEASYGHGGHQHGAPSDFSAAFAIGISLNLAFVVVETVYGILAHSMALVADAGHNLSDVLGLGLSWGATILAKRAPTIRRTYGLKASTILASLANALVLLFVTGGIAWESVRRLAEPANVSEKTVIVVALVGVAVNGVSALLFMSGSKGDLNIRSAFLHLASDAVLALGVAVAGGVILFTGWNWLDPVVSLVLSATILFSTWSLLRSSTDLALSAVPEHIKPEAVRQLLAELPGVQAVHDLHIWAISTTETALTVHLEVPGTIACEASAKANKLLRDRFGIGHCTIQVEASKAEGAHCSLAPDNVV
jgi:cobalt-zinc-cadmium efflux system protein